MGDLNYRRFLFNNLVCQKLIYNERNTVAFCELISTELSGTYQGFKLKIIDILNDAGLNMQINEEIDLGFETDYIAYEHDIITASYYMTWHLIFDRDINCQIQSYIATEDLSVARYVRRMISQKQIDYHTQQ